MNIQNRDNVFIAGAHAIKKKYTVQGDPKVTPYSKIKMVCF